MIVGVPRETIENPGLLPHVEHHLDVCVELSKGDHTRATIWEALRKGTFQMWLDTDGKTVNGMVITEVGADHSPYVTIVFCSGVNGPEWLGQMEKKIGEWAAGLGRKKLRIIGRAGWLRFLEGYSETHRVIERSL